MKIFKIFASLSFMFLIVGLSTVMAQPGPGPVFNPVPVDGGITLLLAAGAAYGVRKAIKAKNSSSEEEEVK